MIERELAAKRITELEAELVKAKGEIDRLRSKAHNLEKAWGDETLRNVFAAQVLSGEFDPPTIAEIRKARGLEPL